MKQRRNRTHTARRTAMCAVLAALAVVVLALGTLLQILDLTAAAVAALVVLLVFLCYGSRYAWLTYAVIGVLGVLLMPQSMASWTFVALLGYYPIIKQKFDRLPRVLAWVIKLLLCTAILGVCFLVIHFLMLGGGDIKTSFVTFFGGGDGKTLMAWAVVGLSIFTFVLFDLLIDRALVIYYIKWQRRVEEWMKP